MTREELIEGFEQGATLTQEEWADPEDIVLVDRLIAEGIAVAIRPWEYKDGFQCKRRVLKGTRYAN